MPELPAVTVYVERLNALVAGGVLEGIRLTSPFVLRTVSPRPGDLVGKKIVVVERLGKRIVFVFEDDLYAVIHLMIAGRLRWRPRGAMAGGCNAVAALDFPLGTLVMTEASTKKRASLHIVEGPGALASFDRGGLEVLGCTLDQFTEVVRRENHTLKRTLTDPSLLSGIGNAWSDEILHRARLSPVTWSIRLSAEEIERLFHATTEVLALGLQRMRDKVGEGFPDKVTAFEPTHAVHGRFGEPCLVCGAPVQRIRYADNETNYCATCQTGGKLLADRSLSRLLKGDWPRTLMELEERRGTS